MQNCGKSLKCEMYGMYRIVKDIELCLYVAILREKSLNCELHLLLFIVKNVFSFPVAKKVLHNLKLF